MALIQQLLQYHVRQNPGHYGLLVVSEERKEWHSALFVPKGYRCPNLVGSLEQPFHFIVCVDGKPVKPQHTAKGLRQAWVGDGRSGGLYTRRLQFALLPRVAEHRCMGLDPQGGRCPDASHCWLRLNDVRALYPPSLQSRGLDLSLPQPIHVNKLTNIILARWQQAIESLPPGGNGYPWSHVDFSVQGADPPVLAAKIRELEQLRTTLSKAKNEWVLLRVVAALGCYYSWLGDVDPATRKRLGLHTQDTSRQYMQTLLMVQQYPRLLECGMYAVLRDRRNEFEQQLALKPFWGCTLQVEGDGSFNHECE